MGAVDDRILRFACGISDLLSDDLADRLDEGRIDLGLDRRGAGIGHLRGDCIGLLVCVVLDVRLVGLSVKDTCERAREV